MSSINRFLDKIRRKFFTLTFDISAIPTAWLLAYWLRDNMQSIPGTIHALDSLHALAVLFTIQIGCFYYFKVYRGLWQFSSISDVTRILKAVGCAVLLTIPVGYMFALLGSIPRSVLPLYGILLTSLLCGARLLLRYYFERHHSFKHAQVKRVLIVGAGLAAEGLIRDLKRSNDYLPIGLLDDHPNKLGQELHGIRVLGKIDDMAHFVSCYEVDLIFIAIASARSEQMRRIVELCEQCGVAFRTLPSLQALASGQVEVKDLREVHIEDLLGRDQVIIDWGQISNSIQGKKIIVTGGGGSIGSELCRQVLALTPQKLLIIDHCEYNAYQIELELKEKFPTIPIDLCLVNVTDQSVIHYIFQQFKPSVVFHAAAYKQVPMLETQVRTAVQNNVYGTQVVAEASVAAGVDKFVLISSDKAVNPTNIMGTTKRVAEIFCQNLNARVATQFITVRFGNVLGSVGSVVPLFRKQLQAGGPLTVTHPDIQRYFMTISEACQLILQAMANGSGGEIFVLDMGKPIKIRYLAEQMIRLAGKEPGKDIQITYTGLRPGEKLFEELFHDSEQLQATTHEKIFKAKFREVGWQELMEVMRMMDNACKTNQNSELFILLKNLVPEFNYLNRATNPKIAIE